MSYMFAPNFEAIGHVNLVLEPENRPCKFGVKSGLSQTRMAEVRQKIFHMAVCLKIAFHPNQPTFGRDEVKFFFFLFFPFFSS